MTTHRPPTRTYPRLAQTIIRVWEAQPRRTAGPDLGYCPLRERVAPLSATRMILARLYMRGLLVRGQVASCEHAQPGYHEHTWRMREMTRDDVSALTRELRHLEPIHGEG